MRPEILVVRKGDGYHVLHGHLHLASILSRTNEVTIDASGEGNVKVIKTQDGIFVSGGDRRLPLIHLGK